jgi:hypothetical protein
MKWRQVVELALDVPDIVPLVQGERRLLVGFAQLAVDQLAAPVHAHLDRGSLTDVLGPRLDHASR